MDCVDSFLLKYKDNIKNINDLLAGEEPTFLFYILMTFYGYLLSDDVDKTISKNGILCRKYLNKLIKLIAPSFLRVRQDFEDRDILMPGVKHEKIVIPDEPVIWAANHAFKDDTLASILAAKRNAYIVFGSLPQFYNSIDGFTAWLNGVVMTNRKVKSSRAASLKKSSKVVQYGTDIMMFPEGVWNKSPNKLLLDFWAGIYRTSSENGISVVPVVHYLSDLTESSKDEHIHTVVDNPIKLYDYSEKQGLEYLREVMATWYYLMMEKYGQDTRDNVLNGFSDADSAWEDHLLKRIKTAARYDMEIETTADYRDKLLDSFEKANIENLERIANIDNINVNNIHSVIYARDKVKELKRIDFQRRF